MSTVREARSSNAALKNSKTQLTAVFTGATKGIGRATLQSFATCIPEPTAIIVGRSASSFAEDLQKLKQSNSKGNFSFIEGDVSLIKSIDTITEKIKTQLAGKKIDLLYESQGALPFAGRQVNAEGLENGNAVRIYGRVRIVQNLLPVMSTNARVVSILGGGQEAKLMEDDLALETSYSFTQALNQSGTIQTLTFDYLAKQYPDKAFIHTFPGLVGTGLLSRSATGILSVFLAWVVEPIANLFALKPADVGERMLYYGTTDQFAKGSWSLDEKGESKEVDVVKEYRKNGWPEKIWEHDQAMFEKALSK